MDEERKFKEKQKKRTKEKKRRSSQKKTRGEEENAESLVHIVIGEVQSFITYTPLEEKVCVRE